MNTKQTKILIRGAAFTLVLAGLTFSAANVTAKGHTSAKPPVVNPQHLPDFYVMTVTNGNTSGPMATWRYGTCKKPHKVKVVVKNLGASYSTNSKKAIGVTFEVLQNGQTISFLRDYSPSPSLKRNVTKEIFFNPGIFPAKGSYDLRATISSHPAAIESNKNNNTKTLKINVRHSCKAGL